MHFNNLALALGALATAVVRADVELDRDDIPRECRDICEPVRRLTKMCDVDDDDIRRDRTEDLLEAQCVCTNDSFDVAKISALCASCITQNPSRDDDDDDDDDDEALEDIEDIMRTCGFSSTTYAPSDTTAVQDITVVATAPTASDQLTTTMGRGGGGGNGGSSPPQTTAAGGGSNSDNGSPSNTGGSGGSGDAKETGGSGGSDDAQETGDPNAAAGLAPAAGLGGMLGVGLYAAGMVAIGAGVVY